MLINNSGKECKMSITPLSKTFQTNSSIIAKVTTNIIIFFQYFQNCFWEYTYENNKTVSER